MPDGKTHFKIWKRFIIPALIFSAIIGGLTYSFILGISCFVGYLLGRYISPDLDLVGINNDESRMMAELKIFGVLLVMWFFPYAYLMRFVGIGKKGHRNFFSHFPFISTVIRVVWLFAVPLIFLYYKYPQHLSQAINILIAICLGLGFADMFHYIADTLSGTKLFRKVFKKI